MSSPGNVNLGINLTTLGTGTAIPNITTSAAGNPPTSPLMWISPTTTYSQITTSTATNYAYTLPLNPVIGQVYTIRNDSADSVWVFPPTTTSSISGPNGPVTGVAEVLVNGSASFMAVSNNGAANTATLTNPYNNPAIVYHQIGGTPSSLSAYVIAPTSGTVTLTALQSGDTYFVNPSAGAVVFNLPAVGVSAGVSYKIVSSMSTPANTITVTATTAVINGVLNGANTIQLCAAKTNVIFGATAANCKIGDTLSLISDGTYWYVNGYAQVSACFTVS